MNSAFPASLLMDTASLLVCSTNTGTEFLKKRLLNEDTYIFLLRFQLSPKKTKRKGYNKGVHKLSVGMTSSK